MLHYSLPPVAVFADAHLVEDKAPLAIAIDLSQTMEAIDARLGSLNAAEAAYHTAIRLQSSFSPASITLADLYRHQQGQERETALTNIRKGAIVRAETKMPSTVQSEPKSER